MGYLGNWGPNHAADPVVCRKNPENGDLEFVLIIRKDGGGLALPGGMVEAGQTIASAHTREFAEEALAINDFYGTLQEKEQYKKDIEIKLFKIFNDYDESNVLYKGIVDDSRNGDFSWIETIAILTILPEEFENIKLHAGDDALKVKWVKYNENLHLFANHKLFLDLAVRKLLNDKKIEPKEDGSYKFLANMTESIEIQQKQTYTSYDSDNDSNNRNKKIRYPTESDYDTINLL